MTHIVYTRRNGTLVFFTKDEKEVALLSEDAIMTYYEANKIYTKLSQLQRDIRCVNLVNLCIENLSDKIIELL